jgi:hypothetical protein
MARPSTLFERTKMKKTMLLLLSGLQDVLRSSGRGFAGIAVLSCVLFAFATPARSQGGVNDWTWMGGSSTSNQAGVYGTLGMPAAGNFPGDRYSASSWTDSSDNFWLFGG